MSDFKNLAAKYRVTVPSKIDLSIPILLMEDQQDQRLIITHHMAKLGYHQVKQVATGLEVYEFLKENDSHVSAIIGSMEAKTMGGIELIVEIRDSTEVSRPPFLISMLNPSKEKIMLATEAGVDEILVKPYMLKDILPKLQQAFRIYHNPTNPEKVYELAKKALRDKDLDKAESIFIDISKISQKAARPWVGQAIVAMEKGQLELAMERLDKAKSLNPHFVHTYTKMGDIYSKRKNFQKAYDMFKRAIELSPLNPLRYDEAAKMLFEMKKYDEAISLLGNAIRNELDFPNLHHFLSQAYYATQNFKLAIRHIKLALSDDKENLTYLNQLGISYKESEQYEEAMKVYNSIIKIEPDNLPALYNKAILLNTTEKIDESLKILDRILRKDPTFEPAKQKRAEYAKKKNESKAS